jgi:hypothetical protein
MARRARQGVNPAQIGIIAVIVAAVVGGIAFALTRSSDSMRSVSELDITDYVTRGDSMAGTEWKITGVIEAKLRWTPDQGQLVSILVEQGNLKEVLPVLLPPEFKDMDVKIGDRFTMLVHVPGKKPLEARRIERS